MQQAVQYINEILGIHTEVLRVSKDSLGGLPMFINEIYTLYQIEIFNTPLILAEHKNQEELSILQTDKQLNIIRNTLHTKVVVVLKDIAAYNRKRLIEKGINFIVPGKQLYLPDLLINLREIYTPLKRKQTKEKLLPSAQFLLIYHIIHRHEKWKIQEHSFKEIAQKLNYTPMAITNAADNLKYHGLVEVGKGKEKFIHFRLDIHELWHTAIKQDLLVNPVLKTVFVEKLPDNIFLLQTNASALPEYTDLNPSAQAFYAIEKTVFYGLQKSNSFINLNENEGKYAIEIWKYNPLTLVDGLVNDMPVVDPLSLYLSLKDNHDERVEMALEQIIDKFIW